MISGCEATDLLHKYRETAKLSCCYYSLTNDLTNLEPQYPEFDEFYVVSNCWLTDFHDLKLWNAWSGAFIYWILAAVKKSNCYLSINVIFHFLSSRPESGILAYIRPFLDFTQFKRWNALTRKHVSTIFTEKWSRALKLPFWLKS